MHPQLKFGPAVLPAVATIYTYILEKIYIFKHLKCIFKLKTVENTIYSLKVIEWYKKKSLYWI